MPTDVTFSWLNGGEETQLKDMPLKGQREILDLQRNTTKYQAAMTKGRFILLCETALAAKKTLDRFGAEKACEAWNATIEANFQGNKGLLFREDSFEADLNAWLDDFVLKRLNVEDLDGAREKLTEATESLGKEMEGIDSDKILAANHELYLLTAYWRLRASGVKEIKTPEGVKALDWSLDNKDATMDVIAEVLTDEDMMQFYGVKKDKELDVEDLVPLNADDVKGKSSPPAESSTESVANSVPS